MTFWHRHHWLRETADGQKVFVCRCGAVRPQLQRDQPVAVYAPAHATLKARRVPTAAIVDLAQRRRS